MILIIQYKIFMLTSQFKLFQVPFIAFYRKECIEPELNINDLWKVYQWDEKVNLLTLSRWITH